MVQFKGGEGPESAVDAPELKSCGIVQIIQQELVMISPYKNEPFSHISRQLPNRPVDRIGVAPPVEKIAQNHQAVLRPVELRLSKQRRQLQRAAVNVGGDDRLHEISSTMRPTAADSASTLRAAPVPSSAFA